MAKPRVRKLLELRTDTPEFLEALDALSSIQSEDSASGAARKDARRHLRFDLEDRSLRLIESFVVEAERVQDALLAVRTVVSELESECAKALGDLEIAERATTRFVEESSALRQARREAEQRAETVSAFLQRFQLTPQELDSLNRVVERKSLPDIDFFQSLERVRKIRDECSELLSGAHQTAGLEIFEQMAFHQNRAQDVVFEWIKRECADGTAGRELESESKRSLYSKAFAEFKLGSPAYYSHGVELVSKGRRQEVTKKFSYLVQEKQHDVQHSVAVSDPIRGLSDLLTTLHEVCAEERDLYQSIFHTTVGAPTFRGGAALPLAPEDELQSFSSSGTNAKSGTLDPTEQQDALERALGGISLLFKTRASQAIESMYDSVACFRAAQVLDFYADTLSSFFPLPSTNLDEDNPLIVVKQLRDEASFRFYRLVEDKASELAISARTRALPGSDLSASLEVLELVRCLRDILNSIRDHSLISRRGASSPEETSKALKAFVVPIRSLVHSADQTFSSPSDACVFAVNNLAALQAVLTLHDFTAPLVEELTFEIGERIDQLARIRSDTATAKTGLSQVLHALERVTDPEDRKRLGEQPGLRAEQVKAAFDAFYRDLSSSIVMPEFDRIDAPRWRHQARSATSALILSMHNTLYDAVKDGGYADVSFLTYSKAQVADLLDV